MPIKTPTALPPHAQFSAFSQNLVDTLQNTDWQIIDELAWQIHQAWSDQRQVFLCGNGGSAANAMHLANDLIYGAAGPGKLGIRAQALSANPSILTCLANDCGYDQIFSHQLHVYANPGDLLIVLSGSGNSPNILKALEAAAALKLTSFAILGYSGGKALELADHPIHFPVNDMQIAENLQTIVGHMLMQYLRSSGPGERP